MASAPSSASSSSSSSSSSSTSSASSRIHKASLVDPTRHSPALLELVDVNLCKPIIDLVVDRVVATVDYAMGRPSSTKPSPQRDTKPFTTFVENVINRAEITTPIILSTLTYIDRARPYLHIALEDWALERVFLGALIVASKYLNDSTLKNIHWALCTGVFGKRDVGRIEREFLDVLDFQLGISEDDILKQRKDILAVIPRMGAAHQKSQPYSATVPSHHRHPRSRSERTIPTGYIPVPELDPSSPESLPESPSSSPSTPLTLEHSSPRVVRSSLPGSRSSSTSPFHLPSSSLPPKTPESSRKPSFRSTTLDLLKSFPVPRSSLKDDPTRARKHFRSIPRPPPIVT